MNDELRRIMEDDTIGKKEYDFLEELKKRCPELYKEIQLTKYPNNIDAAFISLKLNPEYYKYKKERINAGKPYLEIEEYVKRHRRRETKWNKLVNNMKSFLIIIIILILIIFGCYQLWGKTSIPIEVPNNLVKLTVNLSTNEYKSVRLMAAYILDTYPATLEFYDVKTLSKEILYINGINNENEFNEKEFIICPYLVYKDVYTLNVNSKERIV